MVILMAAQFNNWIGVDLDGTLARSDLPSLPGYFIGPPIEEMVKKVSAYLLLGYEVRIFTARMARSGNEHIEKYIQKWLVDKAGLPALRCTSQKDDYCIEIIDNIAINVESNTGVTHNEVIEALRGELECVRNQLRALSHCSQDSIEPMEHTKSMKINSSRVASWKEKRQRIINSSQTNST